MLPLKIMVYNVSVEKKEGESTNSLFRRFSKKMQLTSIISNIKHSKYQKRHKSKLVRKKDCLNRLEKREKYTKLFRLGKIKSTSRHR